MKLVVLFLALALAACSKTAPAPAPVAPVAAPAPAVVAPAPEPVVVTPTPTVVAPAPVAVVKVVKKVAVWKDPAPANAKRAVCLIKVVDYKIDMDVRIGQIRDFGNILTQDVCRF
mgnify:CR=1 FL=1